MHERRATEPAERAPEGGHHDPYPDVSDLAIIGDGRTAALLSRRGTVEWLCLPDLDSPSVFASLLDRRRGGTFWLRPAGDCAVERRYLPGTNVLESVFETGSGAVRVTDLMPVASEEDARRQLQPEREILRRIEGLSGRVELELGVDPRFDYGRRRSQPHRDRGLGWRWEHGGLALCLLSDVDLRPTQRGVEGRTIVRRGDRLFVSLTATKDEPAVIAPLGDAAEDRLRRSVRWWEEFSERCTYQGAWRNAVLRSVLALNLTTFAPSGAVVAAPSCSIPEHVGGERNWDYRYCWLRDGSFTIQALLDLGYDEEGLAFFDWLIHTTRRARPELDALYDIHGRTGPRERILDHLEGYRGSRPVRLGNAATGQRQLDVYGEVIAAASDLLERGEDLGAEERRLLVDLGKEVCEIWREPDKGFWEPRTASRHFTHSKVQAWVGLDRLLRLHRDGALEVPERQFETEREEIRTQVERRGYNRQLDSYVSVLDGDYVDATLLLLALNGYVAADHPRMVSTCQLVSERLGLGEVLLRRHEDAFDEGVAGEEGAFAICSFWRVSLLAERGELDRAVEQFESLLRYGNDVGLFAEEIDPDDGGLLGNFPQGFTHVGLINAALAIESARRERDG